MDKQVIITIGREYGSGGHVIAQDIAKRFNVPYYNRNLIEEVAKQNNFDTDNIKDYDESPRKYLFSRTVQGYSNSPEEILAGLQFDFIKEKAYAEKINEIRLDCNANVRKLCKLYEAQGFKYVESVLGSKDYNLALYVYYLK